MIELAFAMAPPPEGADSGSGSLLALLPPMIMMFLIFYFILIRPQQKKQKQHREMLEALRRGDRIVTAGGIVGTITKANETDLTVEIAKEVKVRVMRAMISDVLAKTEARDAESEEDDEDDEDKKKSSK